MINPLRMGLSAALLCGVLQMHAAEPVVQKSGWEYNRGKFHETDEEVAAVKAKDRGLALTGWAEYDISVPETGWYELFASGNPLDWARDLAVDGETVMRLGVASPEGDVVGQRPKTGPVYKEINLFLTKGAHTIRYRRVGFPGMLPVYWELRPAEGPEGMIRVGVKGSRMALPGGTVKLEVLGGGATETSYDLFLENLLTGEASPIEAVKFPASEKPVSKEVVVTLPTEGIYQISAKSGGAALRPSDVKSGYLLAAKDGQSLAVIPAGNELQFASLFRDGAVLQRDKPLPVWGWGKAGDKVVVSLDQQTRETVIDEKGRWQVVFDPIKAGGPYTLKASSGGRQVTIQNVLGGEVWLLSGQSNMGGPLLTCYGGEEAAKAANFPDVRAAWAQPAQTSSGEQRLQKATWIPAVSGGDPKKLANWVGIQFGFGTELNEALKVPVGLILANRGGTFISTWTSLEAQKNEPAFQAILDAMAQDEAENIPELQAISKQLGALTKWRKAKAEAEAAGKPAPAAPKLSRSTALQNYPGKNYAELIEPMAPFAIRGVLWYQGENDSGMADLYAKRFDAWVKDWRKLWGDPTLPILYVQIAYGSGKLYEGEPKESSGSELKDVQRRGLANPHTAMVATDDLMRPDDNVHYLDKLPVGHRLALAALATVYDRDVEYSGPLYKDMKKEGDAIRLSFSHAKGLAAKGEKLGGFTIAGEDRKWVRAEAVVDGETVVVRSAAVKDPVAVRYSWAESPSGGNLINAASLPAPVFRTDDWPTLTQGIGWVEKN